MNQKKKALYRLIFATTLPIVIQNLLDSTVSMVDVVMMNAISQEAMTAVSLASQASSIIFMFLFGMSTGMTMLGAQYWGKKDIPAIQKAQGIALRFTILVGAVCTLVCLLLPDPIMRIFTPDPVLIELGCRYLRVACLPFILWGISTIYLATLRSTGRVTVCTVIETVTLLMNVALNALFLFVLNMEVTGVALATAISRLAEFVILLVISARSKTVKLSFAPVLERHPALEKDFRRMCVPAIGNDLVWGIAFSAYSAIIGHLSSDAVAAYSIVNVVRNLGCVLCYGLGSASGIILGQILGRGDQEDAIATGRSLTRLSVIAGVIGGLFIAAAIPILVPRANLSDQARDYLLFMMWVNTVYIMGTAVNTTLIAGVFRAGGDTRFGFWCDTIDMWAYAVPLGLLSAFILKLDVKIVYLLLCTDEFVKWPWVFRHYHSNSWAVNITREDLDSEA